MNIPVKKLKSGFELPVFGLGLWQIGGRMEADHSQDESDVAAIRSAIELGITHLDAAEMYGNGHAEELLGRAIDGLDRPKLFVASKVMAENQGYEGVKAAVARSLKRTKLDYLDLYMLHWFPAPGISLGETMRAMDELVDQGLVRHIGVSNFTPKRFEAAQNLSHHPLVCNQVYYNLHARGPETRGILKACQQQDVMLVAWRPLEKGTLIKAPAVVTELAKKYGKTPAQIALNWLISQDHVVTISKTSSSDHLRENLGAIGWNMEPADIELLRAEYPDQDPNPVGSHLDEPGEIPA